MNALKQLQETLRQINESGDVINNNVSLKDFTPGKKYNGVFLRKRGFPLAIKEKAAKLVEVLTEAEGDMSNDEVKAETLLALNNMKKNLHAASYAIIKLSKLPFYGRAMIRVDREVSLDVINKAIAEVEEARPQDFAEGSGRIGEEIYSIVYQFSSPNYEQGGL